MPYVLHFIDRMSIMIIETTCVLIDFYNFKDVCVLYYYSIQTKQYIGKPKDETRNQMFPLR